MARKKGSKDSTSASVLLPEQSTSGWQPVINGEFSDLLAEQRKLSDSEKVRLKATTVSILSKCIPPKGAVGSETGLVMGLVQSGKTMSFTALSSLARDNLYQLIIVITGTNLNLSAQSVDRLKRDLRTTMRNGTVWHCEDNPRKNKAANIQSKLDVWRDQAAFPILKQTVLITVMKNHRHIAHLVDLLGELELDGVSALVIDDEADQASMNAKVNKREESTTYTRILDLRRALPSHTYVQYTATPQAPLLINKIDTLSPRFVELLEPGDDYVGGEEFFHHNKNLVLEISEEELPETWPDSEGPPPSLLRALRFFFLGAADQLLKGQPDRRSMMIHPSQERAIHKTYCNWVRHIKSSWVNVLSKPASVDGKELLKEFEHDFNEIQSTAPNVNSFDRLIPALSQAINICQIEEVNTRQQARTPQISWANSLFHILVGGAAIDRGYTVEELTVTYMPRPRGVGNADTIQQRARFFGYKRKYLGFCRVFLEPGVLQSFTNYVDHERDLRQRLADHVKSGKPMTEWKRLFYLSPDLSPTRASVLDLEYDRGNYDRKWFRQDYPASGGESFIQHNRSVLDFMLNGIEFTEFQGHKRRTTEQKHAFCHVSLEDLYRKLLVELTFGEPLDSQKFTGVLLQLERKLRSSKNAEASIILMSPDGKRRSREIDADLKIKKLFQGKNFDRRTGEVIYPGAESVREDDIVSLQVYRLDLTSSNKVIRDVPTFALWMPEGYGSPWYNQREQ